MAKDPAFLFYPGDWMGGTQWMTHEQKGCYMDLLVLQFNTGQFTEAQAKQVLSICFDVAWPMLKQKFIKDGEYYYNGRLRDEIEKRRNFSESRRLNASNPKKKKKAYAKHMHKHMEDEDENINKDINKDNWRYNFNIYVVQCKESLNNLLDDNDFIKEREKYNPNVDIKLSLEKAYTEYWSKEVGWKRKKQGRTKDIDWKQTFINALSLKSNRVYKKKDTSGEEYLKNKLNQ